METKASKEAETKKKKKQAELFGGGCHEIALSVFYHLRTSGFPQGWYMGAALLV